jgi:hypothetical protein
MLGDIPKAQYVMRRQAIEEEVQRLGTPTADPGIDRAKALLDDFAQFWEIETEPSERRKLLLSLFEQVWAQEKAGSSPCSRTRTSCRTSKPPAAAALGAETGGVPKAGATGVEASFGTPLRSACNSR